MRKVGSFIMSVSGAAMFWRAIGDGLGMNWLGATLGLSIIGFAVFLRGTVEDLTPKP